MIMLQVKFVAAELTPGLENGECAVPGGVSVRDILTIFEKRCGVVIPEENYKFMYPLFNGKPAALDRTIDNDGTLHICRIAIGG